MRPASRAVKARRHPKGCRLSCCPNVSPPGWLGGEGPGQSLIRPFTNKLWPFEEGGPWPLGPWLSALLSSTYVSLRKCLEMNAHFPIYKQSKMLLDRNRWTPLLPVRDARFLTQPTKTYAKIQRFKRLLPRGMVPPDEGFDSLLHHPEMGEQ